MEIQVSTSAAKDGITKADIPKYEWFKYNGKKIVLDDHHKEYETEIRKGDIIGFRVARGKATLVDADDISIKFTVSLLEKTQFTLKSKPYFGKVKGVKVVDVKKIKLFDKNHVELLNTESVALVRELAKKRGVFEKGMKRPDMARAIIKADTKTAKGQAAGRERFKDLTSTKSKAKPEGKAVTMDELEDILTKIKGGLYKAKSQASMDKKVAVALKKLNATIPLVKPKRGKVLTEAKKLVATLEAGVPFVKKAKAAKAAKPKFDPNELAIGQPVQVNTPEGWVPGEVIEDFDGQTLRVTPSKGEWAGTAIRVPPEDIKLKKAPKPKQLTENQKAQQAYDELHAKTGAGALLKMRGVDYVVVSGRRQKISSRLVFNNVLKLVPIDESKPLAKLKVRDMDHLFKNLMHDKLSKEKYDHYVEVYEKRKSELDANSASAAELNLDKLREYKVEEGDVVGFRFDNNPVPQKVTVLGIDWTKGLIAIQGSRKKKRWLPAVRIEYKRSGGGTVAV